MAKKRKAPKSFEQPKAIKSAKYDIEETFDDSEDEFYAGRDKILLDQDADSKRRRRLVEQERDLQPSDEEVLAEQDFSDEESGTDFDEDLDEHEVTSRPRKGSDGEDQDQDDDEDSEEEHWGTNRADYYGDDVIETEEQAKEEENEAKRLHQKQLKNMTEADFGFDENEWTQERKDTQQNRSVVEKLPEAQIPENATDAQKLQILSSRYPEFLPLAKDFTSLQQTQQQLNDLSMNMSKSLGQGANLSDGLPIAVKLNALNAYLATMSMYFAVVTSTIEDEISSSRKITAMAPIDLHQHPIIQTLARTRQLWEQVEALPLQEALAEPQQLATPESEDYLDAMSSHASPPRDLPPSAQVTKTSNIKAQSQKSAKKSRTHDDKVEIAPKNKKSRKSKDKQRPLDLNELINEAQESAEESDFGDEQPLTEEQYAEKAKKRKSLRFYTSQLASKANKRGQASRIAGGDDDLPYKERQRDKKERLMKEAEARGRRGGDEADDFGDGDGDDHEKMPAQRDTNDDYYDTLLNVKQKKKSDKQARAEAYALAAKEGATVYEEETVGADGKRAITYAIAKNKGLAPKRKKEVRNPRVKKKKKYEEKMKKLGSIRQVYKGGEGRGGYGGELTGIKTNVVKSVKLS